MKLFKMVFDDSGESVEKLGVYALSIVNNPAMQSNHIALSEQELHLKVQDEKKHILTGAVMIPNKPILRYDKETKEPYQIYFTEDTIERASEEFMKNFHQSSITAEHAITVDDVTVVESWRKAGESDKSVELGLDEPVGTWFATLKVENMELWDSFIETGLLNGFSIEGFFKPVEVTNEELALSTENLKYMKKNEKSILQKIRSLVLGEEVDLESQVAEVSKWWQDVTNDSFELGTQIMRKPYEEDADPYPLGAGEWELEDGTKILTDKEGIIRYIFEDSTSSTDNDTPDDTPAEQVEASCQTETTVSIQAETEVPVETPSETPSETTTSNETTQTSPAQTETPEASTSEETPAETPKDLAEVAEVVKDKVDKETVFIPHTDKTSERVIPKPKWDPKMSMQERITSNINRARGV